MSDRQAFLPRAHGGCKPVCGLVGALLFGLCSALCILGLGTSAWTYVDHRGPDHRGPGGSYGCGLTECVLTTGDSVSILPLPTEPTTLGPTACKALAMVYDYCGRYNALVAARKAILAAASLAAIGFCLACVWVVAGLCGKRYKASTAGGLGFFASIAAITAVGLYGTQVAGVNINSRGTEEDWSKYHFGLSFAAVLLAALAGCIVSFLHICACKFCIR